MGQYPYQNDIAEEINMSSEIYLTKEGRNKMIEELEVQNDAGQAAV